MPAIQLNGIGSGIDIDLLVSGLVAASSAPLSNMQRDVSNLNAAVSTLSDLGGLLASLKSAVSDLDSLQDVGSYKASSSGSAVVASANGSALPGSFDVTVNALAKEQRTYTDAFASSTNALSQSGSLDVQVGAGSTVSISIDSSDTLESIAGKINASGERVGASVFFDGTNYRLQVRGLDTGAANAVSFTENGTSLGLTTPANTVQAAQDASVTIDGFNVTRATNQISGAIQGVTLALTEETTGPITVNVETDPDALAEKVRSFVNAFNDVNSKIHLTAGFGSIKGTNPELAGDSALRNITTQLSNTVVTTVGSGAVQMLANIGVNLNNDGSLKLDETKLASALEADPAAVASVLAGDDSATNGVMDIFRNLIDTFTDPNDGTLTAREEGMESRVDGIEDRIERETARLTRMEEQLRKQFINMDATVAGNLAQLDYLLAAFGGG